MRLHLALALALAHHQPDLCLTIWSLVGVVAAIGAGYACGAYATSRLALPTRGVNWSTFSALVGALIVLLAVLPSAATFLNQEFLVAMDACSGFRAHSRGNWLGGALILYVVMLTLCAASGFVVAAATQRGAFVLGFTPLWVIVVVLVLGLAWDGAAVWSAP